MERNKCIEALHNYGNMVMRIALNYCRNKYDAEDITQNVFLKLVKTSEKSKENFTFKDEEHLKRWLIRVTINECHSMFVAPWKKKTEYLEDLNIEDRTYIIECKSEIYNAVINLPRKYRIPIYLYYYEGYDSKEIAEILSVKEATVRAQLARGRKILKEKLEEADIYEYGTTI